MGVQEGAERICASTCASNCWQVKAVPLLPTSSFCRKHKWRILVPFVPRAVNHCHGAKTKNLWRPCHTYAHEQTQPCVASSEQRKTNLLSLSLLSLFCSFAWISQVLFISKER